MRSNVIVELFEALAQVAMVVNRQRAGMGIERKGAQRATQARHLQEELFGVPPLRNPEMAQRRQAGIDGVHQPEVSQIAGREFGQSAAARRGAAEGAALALQNLDE